MNLPYHNHRLNSTRGLVLGCNDAIDLGRALSIPSWVGEDRYKCRVTYDVDIQRVEYQKYTPRHIQSLALVNGDNFNYAYKYEDRTLFNELLAKKGKCDEILIIQNGRPTDTSYSNVAFYDGTAWVTPSSFLLPGTMRKSLIERDLLSVADMTVNCIYQYEKICLINAMLDLGEVELPTKNIVA